MMHRGLLALAMLAGLVLNAPAAHAGLVEYVYHNIPATAYTPTDASISAAQANAAAATPNYSFINTAVTFNYNGGGAQTNTFFGTDAAGAAATDTASINQSAFDAKGVINISAAGSYTFNIASADDAARVYLSGALIAEQNFPGSGLSTPSSSTRSLSVGSYAFELFYYQQTGGAGLNFAVSGPAAVSYAVPEPSTVVLLAGAVAIVASMPFWRRRKRRGRTIRRVSANSPIVARNPASLRSNLAKMVGDAGTPRKRLGSATKRRSRPLNASL